MIVTLPLALLAAAVLFFLSESHADARHPA